MENNKKVWLYNILIVMLNIAMMVLTIVNVLNGIFNTDNINYLFIFSIGFWLVSLISILFQIQKLFDWFYKKMASIERFRQPEFFASYQYFLPRDKAYKR